jgi:diguanylate cyclase (GGDEF)-like protein
VESPLEALRRSRLFRNVPQHVFGPVVAGSVARTLQEGDVLLEPNAENHSIFIVMTGALDVHLTDGDTRPHVRVGPGEFVGEVSLVDRQPTTAWVRAAEPTEVLEVDSERLWALIDATPEVARNLLLVLSGRVRHDDQVISEATRLQHHFERVATVDGLTGLRNRRWLDDAFGRQLTRTLRASRPVSLLMLDLDHFKQLNDTFGHLVGDAVLCRIAQVLARSLRPQDLLARYGGEEFAVLLPDTDTDEAIAIAERLREAILMAPASDAEVEGGEPLPFTTVSVGVATAQLSDSLPALLALADAALYRAKAGGRDRVSR